VQKRIYGIETEYGIIFTPEGRKTLPVEKAIRFLFEKLITTEHFLNVFLENGARFYQDTGCHPEYATPECASPRQLIVYDKAGERILEDLQVYAEEKIREERIAGKLSIFKNNTDFVGNSYGCHENYLVDRDVDFYYLAEQLIPFLVTRQIYSGAGKVFQTQEGVHYCVSQRAQHIYQKISGTTTNDRSIINTRDEPHADREKYRRLHVIVGDSNMSEYTNFLKVGACAVVLQMIEDNYINKDFTLRNPVKAIKDISYDTTCHRKLRLDNGREYSPIEIQLEYCEMAQKYTEQYPVSEELRDAVAKWQYVLDCLKDDPDRLDREIDWVIKRKLIQSYIDRNDTTWNDPRVFMLDLQYHDLRLNAGLYYLLERKGLVERVLDDEEVIKAKTEPPPDTRARMRGEFIKLARQNSIQYDLDWSNIRLGNLLNVRVICNNPFETDIEKVAELVRTIQKTNLRKTSLSKLVIQS
jgi:proteasome accessory factor A